MMLHRAHKKKGRKRWSYAHFPHECKLGAKDDDPAGKVARILKFNDVMIKLLVSGKGVRPSDRLV